MYYANEIVKQLEDADQIVIYGARTVAKEVANCLLGEPYNFKISSFIVTNVEGNPKSMLGIPVIELQEAKNKYLNAVVLVAVMEKYLDEILKSLNENGFKKIIPLTFECDLWSEVRGNYYREVVMRSGKKYVTLEEELAKIDDDIQNKTCDVSIYMAKCHADRKLETDFSEYEWEIPIQVGAALTDQVISSVRDDKGENISKKNKEYCELTALYWIWKNDKSQYVGLCHYRRHFNLSREMIKKLAVSNIDVVLTIPILNFPNVRTTYANDHIEEDWEIMLKAIRTLCPEYSKTADKLQRGVFYYGYNMLIARKNILDDYCTWLFPILEYCEEHCKKKDDKYQNRYIGFLAERLLSIYFLHHQEDYNIVHATKHFIN